MSSASNSSGAVAGSSQPPPNWDHRWLFTEEELAYTPSALDGWPLQREREERSKGCNFIVQLGIQLKLPQLTLATASTYLHRFYMQNSLKRHHYYETAATALFLATKVEENMRKFSDIVIACVRAAQKNLTLAVARDDKEFWRWKDCILSKEEYLLESLCFDLTVEVPYNSLLAFTKTLNVTNKQVIRVAWTFLNDAILTMLCVLHPPKTIAAAALYCGAKHCRVDFEDRAGKAWWDVVGVALRDIKKCCNHMALVYENNPLRGDDRPRYVSTPENGPEKTRQRAAPDENERSPVGEKRARSDADGEDPDRKRVRVDEARNGGETPAEHREEDGKEPARETERTEEPRREDEDLEEGELSD